MDNRAFKTPVLTAKRIWECEQCVKKNTYTNTIWTTLAANRQCVYNTDKCKTQIEIYLQFDVDSSAYMGMEHWSSA